MVPRPDRSIIATFCPNCHTHSVTDYNGFCSLWCLHDYAAFNCLSVSDLVTDIIDCSEIDCPNSYVSILEDKIATLENEVDELQGFEDDLKSLRLSFNTLRESESRNRTTIVGLQAIITDLRAENKKLSNRYSRFEMMDIE